MQRLEPHCNEADVAVKIPGYAREVPSEFETQAYLFMKLRELGHEVRGEVRVSYVLRNHRGTYNAQSQFDIVIYENGRASQIVEVKAYRRETSGSIEHTRQAQRYRMFGLPVTFVFGMADAQQFIAEMEERNAASRAEWIAA